MSTIMVINDDLYEQISKRMKYWEQHGAFGANGVIDMTGIAFQSEGHFRKMHDKDKLAGA